MGKDGRPPKMSIPVQATDEDVFITETFNMTVAELERLRQHRDALLAAVQELKSELIAARCGITPLATNFAGPCIAHVGGAEKEFASYAEARAWIQASFDAMFPAVLAAVTGTDTRGAANAA
jgi:hypothetical protein